MDSTTAGYGRPKPKTKPVSKTIQGFKLNIKQTVATTLAVSSVFGIVAFFVSKKSKGAAIASALVGAGLGFFADARIQRNMAG